MLHVESVYNAKRLPPLTQATWALVPSSLSLSLLPTCCSQVRCYTPVVVPLFPEVFRPSLFAALIQVATLGLSTCQAFEVTNLLWACANLLTTSMSTMTVEMKTLLSDLMDAVELFLHEHLHELNGQVLVSALVSIATLYPMHLCDGLFESVCNTLVLRCKELSFKQKSNVQIACRIMSRHNMQRVQDLSQRVCQKCPEMAFYVSLG